jgi:hypothetical protein
MVAGSPQVYDVFLINLILYLSGVATFRASMHHTNCCCVHRILQSRNLSQWSLSWRGTLPVLQKGPAFQIHSLTWVSSWGMLMIQWIMNTPKSSLVCWPCALTITNCCCVCWTLQLKNLLLLSCLWRGPLVLWNNLHSQHNLSFSAWSWWLQQPRLCHNQAVMARQP